MFMVDVHLSRPFLDDYLQYTVAVAIRSDVALAMQQQAFANPDASVWRQCPSAATDRSPFPSDRKLRQAVLALKVLASDEGQPDQLRRDARSLKYWLCTHANDCEDADADDWTWVLEHFAPNDEYATFVLKTAMDVAPEPDEHDLNVLLWFRLVKLEINDCWDDHHIIKAMQPHPPNELI